MIAVGIVGLYFVNYVVATGLSVSLGKFDASFARLEIDKDALRMVNPKIEGVTDDGGRYAIRADYAEPGGKDNKTIRLSAIDGKITQSEGRWAQLTAPEGVYESGREQLTLMGDIEVTSESGMTAHLTSATVDVRKQLVTSAQPVTVETLNGEVRSDRLRIDMAAGEVLFDGNVRVHLLRAPARADAAAAPRSGLSVVGTDSREPIDIFAPQLRILDKQKVARFQGGVAAEQGASRLTAREMKIDYVDAEPQSGAAGTTGEAEVRRIEAIDDVRLVSNEGRQATASHLLYDVDSDTVTLSGGVLLSQADDWIRGERFISELGTGRSRFAPGGRVHTHLAARRSAANPRKPQAESVTVATGQLDLSGSRGQPIDIESNKVDLDDRQRLVTFSGAVRAVQGDMVIESRRMQVKFTDKTAENGSAGAGEAADIASIAADGKVQITTRTQTVTSDWALFEAAEHTITIGGNVVLSQGKNVIKGDRLVIDTVTGRSRLENETDLATGGRVRGLFVPRTSNPLSGVRGGEGAAPQAGGAVQR